MSRSRNRLSLVLVTMLLAAGCADGGNTTDDQAGADGQSPLAPYLGDSFSTGGGGGGANVRVQIGGGGGTEPTEEQLAQRRKVEDAIAACMRQEGFQYVPMPPESDAKSKFNEAFNLPPDKFAEQYGYGISTIDWGDPMEDNPDDPNTAIRNALSEQAKKSYNKALNGSSGNEEVVAAKPKSGASPNAMDMGCRGKAMTEVYGENKKMADMEKFDSLFRDLEALQKRIGSDPRVTEAAKAWSDCMADGGKTGLSKPEEAPEKVQEQLAELTGDDGATPAPGEKGTMPEPKLDDVDPAALAELRKSEIELAKLDQSCRKTGYEDAYKTVQFELEEEFVAANKAQLEQFKETTSNAQEGK